MEERELVKREAAAEAGSTGGALTCTPRRFAWRGRRATSSRTCGGRVTACIVTGKLVAEIRRNGGGFVK